MGLEKWLSQVIGKINISAFGYYLKTDCRKYFNTTKMQEDIKYEVRYGKKR